MASASHADVPPVRTPHLAHRAGAVIGRILVFLLVWVGLALLIAAGLIRFFWGEITVGQMLLNLVSVETDGGGGALVWVCILGIGVLPLLITTGLALALRRRARRPRPRQGDGPGWRSPWLMRAISSTLAASIVVLGTASFAAAVGLADYVDAGNSEYDLADHYVSPRIVGDDEKRNLVLIYLESGEAALEDEELFEKDAFAPLKEVTQAAQGWQSVENLQQYAGGGWTMSGLTATQCGIPLAGVTAAASSGTLGQLREGEGTYLDGTTCLGDLLEDHGYTNVFLGGASSSFAEKNTFLGSHGYSRVLGLDDWRAAGEPEGSFRSDWGLSDERLMKHARDEVDALHAESLRTGEPFNLSVLTLDTHEPVHVFDYCEVDTEEEATSVFACSMAQVAGFVEHLEQQGYLEDTAVVVMGDHLKPVNAGDSLQRQLEDHRDRAIFNRIWIPGADQDTTLRAGVDQLSMYPTLLEAAGLTPADREAGLGVSAFSTEVPEDSAQSLPPESYSELLRSRSPEFYSEAWSSRSSVD
ncbi:LTA synthase family protein [Nesterenkonia sp. E16_7]|uniref:sulfatase-like hydrolase/transferase n=1 Tax=unclassified Nesterenkonia TaxID=2629769 RepID=UPI001A9253B9|nr:LTA synthase family protein [Nesterenkonia sp. E16_10]MBO0598218.1 LTA synthase family protein [Nesterenkonia sp. E16_7]